MVINTDSIYSNNLGPYSTLLRQRDAAGDNWTLENAQQLTLAQKHIQSAGLTKRFIYEVKNSKDRVVAHLLGTIHVGNEAMATDARLHDLVKKSSRLFLECVPEQNQCFEISNPEINGNSFDHSMEASLLQTARNAGIPCSGLETLEELATFDERAFDKTIFKASQGVVAWMKHRTPDEKWLETVESYQLGNAQQQYNWSFLLHSPEFLQHIVYSRNINWIYEKRLLNTLIKPGQQPDLAPLCIAVGLGHLLGKPDEPGINSLLRKKHFKVQRLAD